MDDKNADNVLPEKLSVLLLRNLVGVPEMLLEILDRDVAHSTLHHLHGGQRIWLLSSPELPDPVQILLPIDPVHVLEVSVHGVPVILDHLAADLTLEGLELCHLARGIRGIDISHSEFAVRCKVLVDPGSAL